MGSTHPNIITCAALSVRDPCLKLTAESNCDLTKIGTVGELAKSLARKSQVTRQRKRNIHRHSFAQGPQSEERVSAPPTIASMEGMGLNVCHTGTLLL